MANGLVGPTTPVVVLERMVARLIDRVARLSPATCFVCQTPDPPANLQGDIFCTVRLGAGRFSEPNIVGGGQNTVFYEGTTILSFFNRIHLDRTGQDLQLLIHESLGLLHLETECLRALAGQQLFDQHGNELLTAYMLPVGDSDPQATDDQPSNGRRELILGTDFLWDMNDA